MGFEINRFQISPLPLVRYFANHITSQVSVMSSVKWEKVHLPLRIVLRIK